VKSRLKNLLFDSNKGKIKLNEKASIFLLCLGLATFFWFLSSLSKRYTTDLSIPLKYKSYNKEFILLNKPVSKIIVTVSGSGFELLGEQISLDRKEIVVDLTKAVRVNDNRFAILTARLRSQVIKYLDKDLESSLPAEVYISSSKCLTISFFNVSSVFSNSLPTKSDVNTGTPKFLKILQTVDFPLPIPPVIPTFNIIA